MLGPLIDYLYVMLRKREGILPDKVEHVSNAGEVFSEQWFCFLPDFIFRTDYFREKIIPEEMKAESYILPRPAVQPDPKLTRKFLEKMVDLAAEDASKTNPGGRLNVLGMSLGNAPAYKFANYFQVDRLVSVVPGSFLPECIWESIATRKIARGSGKSFSCYERELSGFSPANNLGNLDVNSVELYLGGFDKMVPFPRGRELSEMINRKGLNLETHIYPVSGHAETIFYFANEFSKERN